MDNHSFVSGNETFNFQGDWVKLARSEKAALKLQKEYAWFRFFKGVEGFPLVLPRRVSLHNNRALITSSIYGNSVVDRFLSNTLSEREFKEICNTLLAIQGLTPLDTVPPVVKEDLYKGRLERLGAAEDIKEWFKPVLSKVPELTYSHGDYHFGNLLLTERGVGAIDPGEFVTFDPRYDWAKLYHSLRGYNHLIENVPFILDTALEETFFELCPFPREEIEVMTGFLFLSMLPLHTPANQFRILEKANEILNPLGLRRVYLSDYSKVKELYVDFDGTIVSLEKDFANGTPNLELIKVLQDYHANGRKVIVYTARGMLSNKGDLEAICTNVQPRIEKWLEENRVPYDELRIGKPFYPLLIDDQAKNPEDINSWIF